LATLFPIVNLNLMKTKTLHANSKTRLEWKRVLAEYAPPDASIVMDDQILLIDVTGIDILARKLLLATSCEMHLEATTLLVTGTK
jgi:hypothetical protein